MEGGFSYERTLIEPEHIVNGEARERWETLRIIEDPEEHKLAKSARRRVRTVIASVCSESRFGLLAPEDRKDDLDAKLVEAQQVADEYNKDAKLTTLSVDVILGRVEQDDVRAVKAIKSELRGLIDDMQGGLKTLNVKGAREAASKAKGLGQMLSPEIRQQVEEIVAETRKEASRFVKAGEAVALKADFEVIARIDAARTAFLDLDDAAEVAAPEMDDARAIDLTPHSNGESAASDVSFDTKIEV
jgi:hypothetical protein